MTSPTIYQLPTPLTGSVQVLPNFKYMVVGDNQATVTTAGYLNQVNLESYPIQSTDIINMLYSFNPATQIGTFEQFSVSITNGVITLSALSSAGEVTLPTIANHIATYTNTAGHLSEDPATAISGGNIQAGLSGTAGTLASFPATASKGSLVIAGVANTGNTNTTISNVAMGQASVISIPDPGAATADFAIAPAALVNNNLIKASGTAGLVADAGIAAANVMVLNASNVLTGSGQITLVKANGTEAANAVTASGNAGVITTSTLTTAGGSSYVITWTNTLITSTSVILLTIMGGTNTTENITLKATSGTGSATLTIYNNTAATSLNGTILIGYTVF
jgi:hypothetical protein